MLTLTPETHLNEVIRWKPAAIEVFNDLGIDFCCAGEDTLEQAAAKKNILVDSIMHLLNRAQAKPATRYQEQTESIEAFHALDIPTMIKTLEQTHHYEERERMTEVDALLNKILLVHYEHHGEELLALHTLYSQLQMELLQHFAREEKEIFPLMLRNPIPSKEILDQLEDLEGEHDVAGNLIHQIQERSNQFSIPEDACHTYEKTYIRMIQLTEDIFVHIFKENSILFPKYRKQLIEQ